MSQRQQQRDDALNYRTFAVRAHSIDAEKRSVEAVITTEAAVPMFDWERYELVPEVLLMKGADYPKQVPFLNAHSRSSVDDQLGSAREIRTERDELIGRMFFAKASQAAFEKVQEGHVTDVSAGYQVQEKTHVPKGYTQNIGGREFTGPVNVVTKWKLREVSLVPIGADEQAKLRGFQSVPRKPQESFKMNEALRALCVARGMDAKLSDEDAQKWMLEHFGKDQPGKREEPADMKAMIAEAGRAAAEAALAAVAQKEAKVAGFRADVDAACELAGLSDERTACYGMADIAAVRTHLLKKKAESEPNIGYGLPIRGGEAQRDKHVAAVGTALVQRAVAATNCQQKRADELLPPDKRAAGWEQFRNASLLDMARECLHADGINTRGLSREQIAIAALGWPNKVGLRADPAYHTTGSFTKLTQDAVNKSMMVGYQEFPATWRTCFRQGASVPDLKTIHRLRMGAIPNLPDWPTNTAPEQASFKDAEETYKVQPKSMRLSFSWDLLVNDDMDAISRAPQMFGDAAARTVNALAWAQITSNPTMEDGQALFLETPTGNRKRQNLTAGAGTPSVATLQTLSNLMQQMRGENTPEQNESQDILNLSPAFIVGPSALSTTIRQLVLSAYDPAANSFMVYNTATQLIPVIEPLLDSNSTTAWYLFASTSRIDTVEVTFLQGHESPVTRQWMDEETLSQNWAVLQAVAAKALNHRGVQKHAGA